MDGLITPRPGPGVCPDCFNFTRETAGRCRACRASESHLDAIVPISYAPAGGRLHHDLADYKRAAEPAVPHLVLELAHILSRFLVVHERCIAESVGVEHFDTVEVVPSSDPHRDRSHPLRRIVDRLVPETSQRHRDVLCASGALCTPHEFDPGRFIPVRPLDGHNVLLVDDVWTTGASAQSAAAVLKRAGAEHVAAVVIGRYVNGCWGGINARLAAMGDAFDHAECVICAATTAMAESSPTC